MIAVARAGSPSLNIQRQHETKSARVRSPRLAGAILRKYAVLDVPDDVDEPRGGERVENRLRGNAGFDGVPVISHQLRNAPVPSHATGENGHDAAHVAFQHEPRGSALG